MFFAFILGLTALSIAGCAAFFSIYGLASIFGGSFYAVIFMGTSIEAGKLVAVSYAYRFWNKINILFKISYIFAILILMLITSVGVFGFLSAAYQEDTLPLEQLKNAIELLQQEKDELMVQKKKLDDDIDSKRTAETKNEIRAGAYKEELDYINSRVRDITSELQELKNNQIKKEAHTGPIIYIAKVFKKDIDDATKYMIMLIIFVFDPLAIMLTLAFNSVLLANADGKIKKINEKLESEGIKIPHGATPEELEHLLQKFTNRELTDDEKESRDVIRELLTKKRLKATVRKQIS